MLYRYLSRKRFGLLNVSFYLRFCVQERSYCTQLVNTGSSPSVSPSVSVSNIKTFLENQKVEFSDGYTNLIAECSTCKKKSLFINKVSGFCICHECRKSGLWNNGVANKTTGYNPLSLEKNESIHVGQVCWKSLCDSLTSPGKTLTSVQQKILDKFNLVNFPVSLLKKLNVKFDENESEVCVPLTNTLTEVGYKRITGDGETTFPNSDAAGFIADLHGHDTAIVVPSLRDLLALSLSKLPSDIISLPYGQQKLPQEILALFEKYKKIVLWFDNDSASWDNVRVFAKKLCEHRCYLVSPAGSQESAFKAYTQGHNVSKIVNSAEPVSHPSVITFSSLRQDVMFDLQNIEKVSGVKWKRFPVLSKILKGHRRGELTIVTGPTGCGKTTFMSEFSLDLAMQGVATLWGSFEIKNQRLARTMLQQFTMIPLENNMDNFHHWADRFEQLPLYFMAFHGQQSLELVMEVVEHATYVHDIAHVIIDNVQFMLGLTTSDSGFLDRFYRQDALIGAFRNFATKANCHVTLVIHPRKEREGEILNSNSIFGGAKASQEADNVLIIQTKTLSSLKIKKYLQVAKNRYTGDLGVMPLEFDQSVLSFAQKKTQ